MAVNTAGLVPALASTVGSISEAAVSNVTGALGARPYWRKDGRNRRRRRSEALEALTGTLLLKGSDNLSLSTRGRYGGSNSGGRYALDSGRYCGRYSGR